MNLITYKNNLIDPSKVSFDDLLDLFWSIYDPTTFNRQGPDVGTQYRSAIFYLNNEQKEKAESSKANIETEEKSLDDSSLN